MMKTMQNCHVFPLIHYVILILSLMMLFAGTMGSNENAASEPIDPSLINDPASDDDGKPPSAFSSDKFILTGRPFYDEGNDPVKDFKDQVLSFSLSEMFVMLNASRLKIEWSDVNVRTYIITNDNMCVTNHYDSIFLQKLAEE